MASGSLYLPLAEFIGDLSHLKCEASFVEIRSLRVACWTYRNPLIPEKTPIVVIHGGPAFTHNYMLPLKLLCDKGYPIIFYDQCGCGASTFVNNPDTEAPWLLTISYYIEELAEIVAYHRLKRYYIYGSSWGSIIAQEFAVALALNEDTSSQSTLAGIMLDGALCDSQLYISSQWKHRISKLPLFTQNMLKKLQKEKDYDSPLAQSLDHGIGSHFSLRVMPRPDCFETCLQSFNPKIYRAMQGPSEFALSGVIENWSITDRLHIISVPTLVLYGEFDTMTEQCSQAIADNIPTAWPLVCIPRAGHLKLLDEPFACIEIISRFLKTIEVSSTCL